jgi:uncharacterized protein (TIRG00374 family)
LKGTIGRLKTALAMLATFATALAIVAIWWQLGLPRVVFSYELAPVPRCQNDASPCTEAASPALVRLLRPSLLAQRPSWRYHRGTASSISVVGLGWRDPGHEVVDVAGGVAVEKPGEGASQVDLGVDGVELTGLDQRGEDAALIGTGESRILAAPGESADRALDGVGIPRAAREPWRPGWSTTLLVLLFVGMGYLLAARWSGLGELADAVLQIGFSGIGLVVALSLASFGLRYGRWWWYLDVLGHRMPLWQGLQYFLSGFLFVLTPARSGELVRCLYLRRHGVPYPRSVAVFFAERLSDVTATAILALSVGALHVHDHDLLPALPILLAAALIALLSSVRLRERAYRWVERLQATWLGRSARRLLEVLAASSVLLTGKVLGGSLVLGLIAWGAQWTSLYVVLGALGAEVSFSASLAVYAVSSLLGSLSFIPGGLGSTDVVMGALLVALGIDPTDAVVATLVCRAATLGFAIALGALAMLSINAFWTPVRCAS